MTSTTTAYSKVENLALGFKYSQEFKILICSTCKMAIESKNAIYSHLKTHSPKVDLEVIEPKKVALPTFY